MNLLALLTPNVGYFLSPFLGIIPAALTQAFLLRRCLLFISSLSSFWPRLAHPVTRWIFGGIMGCLILVSSSAGTVASVMIWKSPNLWNLEKSDRVSNPCVSICLSHAEQSPSLEDRRVWQVLTPASRSLSSRG